VANHTISTTSEAAVLDIMRSRILRSYEARISALARNASLYVDAIQWLAARPGATMTGGVAILRRTANG
jgi:hypothetical protein